MSNYLDFVVFDASYKPLFVIDLVKNNYSRDGMLSKFVFTPTLFIVSTKTSLPKNKCVLTAYILSE